MKAGLEIHQQLAGTKLYCQCPTELADAVEGSVERRLRPAGGEERTVDSAAAFQASQRLLYRYELSPSSCLVELDEEPPRPLSEAAVDTALTVALLLGCRPVEEIQVMRKIVVDGSNTSGFQRTALVGIDGAIEVDGRHHAVLSVCLEEDAARKVGERDGELVYRLDRLGVPLVEIATGPTIQSGAEAKRLAQELGALLRATRKVRRGIGTIREDLNVSVEGGRRIEIKGVQELRLIDAYVEREVARQEHLLRVRDELLARRASVRAEVVEVGAELDRVTNKVVRGALSGGGLVLAVALPGFSGLLGRKSDGEERLGRELADYARTAGVGGILHSDELPGAGFAPEDVARVRAFLALDPQGAFALVADAHPERARRAAERVRARAHAALEGIPGETRDPLAGGRTRYSRPIPGRDRMYPETDVPPVPVSSARLARLRAELPERPDATARRIAEKHGLSPDLAGQLVYGGELDRFEPLVAQGHPASRVARLLTQELPEATSAVETPFDPSLDTLARLLAAESSGRFAKEGTPRVLAQLARGAASVEAALAATGLSGLERAELEAIVARVVAANRDLLKARGPEAFSALMGDVMKEVRGRRDGREIADVLQRAIRAEGNSPPSGGSRPA